MQTELKAAYQDILDLSQLFVILINLSACEYCHNDIVAIYLLAIVFIFHLLFFLAQEVISQFT